MIGENNETLDGRMAHLRQRGADRFDPVRFRFVASLIRRSERMTPGVRRRIEEKARSLLDAFETRLDGARQAAGARIQNLASEDPEAAAELRRRFDEGNFQDVERASLDLSWGPERRILRRLIEQLDAAGDHVNPEGGQLSMDQQLRAQEDRILGEFDDLPTEEIPRSRGNSGTLRAFSLFKRILVRRNARQMVAEAIRNLPEDPGHLNGQMIATRCLEAMGHLSPDYLSRYVAFAHALMGLEGVGRGRR